MGAIPVLETYGRRDGFYRTFDDLPVLWVDHYDNVTPSLLEEAYPRILRGARSYKFEKLTNWWWADHINSFRDGRARDTGRPFQWTYQRPIDMEWANRFFEDLSERAKGSS